MIRRLSLLAALLVVYASRGAHADGTLLTDDTWNVTSCGCWTIDGGLVVGFPAALPTGLTRGIGAGVTYGHRWTAGARAAWTTATESTTAWEVTHADLRLRITGGVEHLAGRGSLGLRLGLGGTLVHESRERSQGMRAGLTGDELSTSAFAMLPALDVEGVVAVHVFGPWLLTISGGPTFELLDGSAHAGWSAELGVAWQP
jgi:hypothetical protein